MELTSCPLCGGIHHDDLWTKGDARYVRCTGCSLVFENPRFTDAELTQYYSDQEYYVSKDRTRPTSGYTDYFTQCTTPLLEEYFAILAEAAGNQGSQELLDIGCGPGGLLKVARRNGWKATGLEVSRWAVEVGRSEGLEIIEGTLESAALPPDAFDVVSMFDVLEHLPHPVRYLSEIHRVIRPGGVLVVETPNIRGFFARTLYRGSSDLVKPRAHICLYDPSTAARLFAGVPFASTSITTFPYCRRFTVGYVRSLIASRIRPGHVPIQLTWDESLRIIARK